ncbi:MAG: hypothetical protein GX111_11265 [Clostridiales bacterium]|nr:hypothetical protein [Clostridiales bacterium]
MKQRYKHNRIRFSNSIIEILMCIGLANRYKDEGINDKFVFWTDIALYNASGKYELQERIKKAIEADEQFDISIIYNEIFGKPNDVYHDIFKNQIITTWQQKKLPSVRHMFCIMNFEYIKDMA